MSAATRLVADVPLKHSRFACYNTCWCVLLAVIVIDAFGGSARYNVEAAVMDNVAQSSSGGLRNYNRGYLDAENDGCQPDKLTVYKVILHTFWSRDKFPKHYPDWSPSAQWSKVFGRSHDKSFTLFRLGQRSSVGVKAFAESGRSDLLEQQSQGEGGIYDEFNAPPITSGVGRTEAEFFVDGNHSRVSLMARIIPSPDWFIGIDSFDLCVNGNWLDSITIEVDPMDAGTDNGFTFTAPNWPTEPQGVAYRITSRYPAHPAGSFFYPYMKRLPAIGTFQFIKVKEYELSEVFHHSEDDHHYEVLNTEHLTQNSISVLNNGNSDIETAIEEEIREQEVHQYPPKMRSHLQQFLYTTTSSVGGSMAIPRNSTSSTTTYDDRDANTIKNKDEFTTIISIPDIVPRGNKDAIMNSIVDSYRSHSRDHRRKKYRKPKKIRPPRDCRVSEWSPWSSCSKSCGIGEMQRRREVIKHARRGGRLCPPLLETKWCGSARSCNRGFYQW